MHLIWNCATERFANTIDYASAMNVQEEKL